MEPSHYFAELRKRWVTICLFGLIGAAVALALTQTATPQYRTTTTVFFSLSRGDTVTELSQGAAFTQNLVESFAEVVTEPVVLDPVIRDLRLDTTAARLAGALSVQVTLDTVLVHITATDASPERAAEIANAVGAQLRTTVAQLSPTGPDNAKPIEVTTVAEAPVPRYPFSPQKKRNLATGLAAGLALGVGLVCLRLLTDNKVRGEDEVRTITDAPVIGTIEFDRSPSLFQGGTQGPRAESFRRIRTNLPSLSSGSHRSIVITSSVHGEGKTTTAVNLAVAMAAGGVRVLLVDADLRRSAIAAALGLEQVVGLSSVLVDEASAEEAIQRLSGGSNLFVLPAGPAPHNPGEYLGSDSMSVLLADLRQRYDVVLLDTPPLIPLTDAAMLSQRADGVLLVVDSRRTSRALVRKSVGILEQADVPLLGVVLNKVGGSGRFRGHASGSASASQRAARPIDDPGATIVRARTPVAGDGVSTVRSAKGPQPQDV